MLGAVTQSRSGRIEIVALAVLYGVYEVVRGARRLDETVALRHAREIVALEQYLHVFGEGSVQRLSARVSLLPDVLAYAYPALHVAVSIGVLWWIYRKRPAAFPAVRTTLVATTVLGLAGYLLFPAAPPRLAVPGLIDTVSRDTPLDLGSTLLRRFYNPFAAVPSLHVAYAVVFGVALLLLARAPAARAAGAVYPALVVIVVVATGNHFFFDAAAGVGAAVGGASITWLLWSFARLDAGRSLVEHHTRHPGNRRWHISTRGQS